MKRMPLLCSFLLISHFLFAQNVFPSSGNVGIGTTSPTALLDLRGLFNCVGGGVFHGIDGGIYPGNLAAYFLGPSDGSANIIVQGNGGTGAAFWLTANDGMFKIGGNGGSEPPTGGVNIDYAGHVGINTLNTSGFNLTVAGSAAFDQVTVETISSNNPNATPWADYVFDKDYQLPSIYSIADYIKANNHLPGIPTTAEVKKNGLDLGATEAKLLEKIEQLTLYTIQLQQQMDSMKTNNTGLQLQINELKKNAR